jgi:hypothetical protein
MLIAHVVGVVTNHSSPLSPTTHPSFPVVCVLTKHHDKYIGTGGTPAPVETTATTTHYPIH